MKKFEIIIEETISDTFTVYANNLEQAMSKATEKYFNGDFVVKSENVETRTMMARDIETDEETNWIDF